MSTEEYIKTMLSLQYLGIQVENTEPSSWNMVSPIVYKFSVPEKSEIKIESVDYDSCTSDGLIQIAKETLMDIICESFEEDDVDLLEDFKKNTSDYAKFYAKVRKGEIWTKELGVKELEKLKSQVGGYKEV